VDAPGAAATGAAIAPAVAAPVPRLPARLAYGLYALPLAFVALPVYVHVPALYARNTELTLAAVGAILLATRLLDAFADPFLGTLTDRLQRRMPYALIVSVASLPLALGFALLVMPNAQAPALWLIGSLVITYLSFSLATIAHQSWGAVMAQTADARLAVTSVREALGLLGVMVAAALPVLLTQGLGPHAWPAMAALFGVLLLLACAALFAVPRPAVQAHAPATQGAWHEVLRTPRFRSLLLAFLLNGIAAALPATLVVFFIEDVLQAKAYEGLFLVLYFVAGALAMPLWLRLAQRIGQTRVWMISMGIAVASFIGALFLGPGDIIAYAIICVATGVALGADLAVPPALLASVIAANGHAGQEGKYFGVWSFVTKLNLALAAGLALPLLGALGYAPGSASGAQNVQPLVLAYCLLPCAFKLMAWWAVWRFAKAHPQLA
jgi:glycoside/pentoside/hexuronide:cation symporter, GPH family